MYLIVIVFLFSGPVITMALVYLIDYVFFTRKIDHR